MLKIKILRWIYKHILKPLFFTQDAELVHNIISRNGEFLGKHKTGKLLASLLFKFENTRLNQKISNINFSSPIGLSAGFDYDGHMAEILSSVGFGFNTVGTVTAKPYGGNEPPRLKRLPKSKSLLVNKGFKSEGVDSVINRLRQKDLSESVIGISVGSSNLPEVNTIDKAVTDYIESFNKLKNENYVRYFELNISCPNTALTEGFGKKDNLILLLEEIRKLNIAKPIYLKMANELDLNSTDILVKTSLEYGVNGFIFSNLVKNRANSKFDQTEIKSMRAFKGNFSGKPVYENSNKLIHHIYKEYGKYATIIGCGGVFSAEDAYEKIKHGASLVQLITGMIYEGPQLIGEINSGIIALLNRDRLDSISQAVGAYHR